jgi:aminopeptidase N
MIMRSRILPALFSLSLFWISPTIPYALAGDHPAAASDPAGYLSRFSTDRLMADVRWLSRRELKGRGFGTPELDAAADYIEKQFRSAGLLPGGDREESYFQTWTASGGEPETEATLKNVVGVIPGANPKWRGQSVVVGAHYDHLGLGWPDGDEGRVHPGADDNASGVAVLLELARVMKQGPPPERTVVFVAFTSEEYELLGSRHYLSAQKRYPADRILAMIDLDSVGRLAKRPLQVIGTESAAEWTGIFREAELKTGVPLQWVKADPGESDEDSFLAVGIPAVQLYSGRNGDYHRPTDTVRKIKPAGMVKVASVAQAVIEHLARRPRSLTSTVGFRKP